MVCFKQSIAVHPIGSSPHGLLAKHIRSIIRITHYCHEVSQWFLSGPSGRPSPRFKWNSAHDVHRSRRDIAYGFSKRIGNEPKLGHRTGLTNEPGRQPILLPIEMKLVIEAANSQHQQICPGVSCAMIWLSLVFRSTRLLTLLISMLICLANAEQTFFDTYNALSRTLARKISIP